MELEIVRCEECSGPVCYNAELKTFLCDKCNALHE